MIQIQILPTYILAFLILSFGAPQEIVAQTSSLPLFQIQDLDYQGAFRIPSGQFGASNSDYSTGSIAYNDNNGSLFLSGHRVFGTVGEFSIPTLVNNNNLNSLNEASVLQNFRQVLDVTSNGNPQNIDEITGMAYIGNKLFINAMEFYDAPANNTHTTLVIEDPSDIENSVVNGYYALDGAAHTAGWISKVPNEWVTFVGDPYIAGNSSKLSINGRLPIGVTAFGFDPIDINGTPSGTVPTTTLLDYSLSTPLHADYNTYDRPDYNVEVLNGDNSFTGHTITDADIVVGSNNLWTEESQASYGQIIPGTRTYMTIGSSGGHNSGIGYKPTQNNGNVCGGPCAYDADDYYNYYWLWDMNDLIAVKNGLLNPYDVRPYDYGEFNAPFQFDEFTQTPEFHPIFGGTYDMDNEILYLAINDGASIDQYAQVPIIAAYKFSNTTNCAAAGTTCDDGNPNTINDVEDGFCSCSGTLAVSNECDCPTPAEPGNIVTVQNVSELQNALDQANNQNGNMTIIVEPGLYQLNSNLRFINETMADLTIKGSTGNRDDVVIKGLGWNNNNVTHIFNVAADRFTIADMTIGEVYYHPIQVHSNPFDADDFTAINIRIIDAKEQLLKVSGGGNLFADRGAVYCSEFEFTQGIAYQFYTGGIDAHRANDWIVHNNVFKGIRSPDNTLAEHAIHFWQVCENTIITANQISNCDRGIGFGLGDSPNNGHVGGIIMNNFVHTNRDVGIGLEYSPDTKVYNNTVITENYPHSIEYRFTSTVNVEITNNLVSGNILQRNGASATLTTNHQVTNLTVFEDAANYDYHLVGNPASIIDAGTPLPEVTLDIDCETRPSGAIDIGADEKFSCPYTIGESGNTNSNNTYHASYSITSNAIIGADVIYKAGNYIELNNGFSVNAPFNFLAIIENCQ